jgi:hypothetical protein
VIKVRLIYCPLRRGVWTISVSFTHRLRGAFSQATTHYERGRAGESPTFPPRAHRLGGGCTQGVHMFVHRKPVAAVNMRPSLNLFILRLPRGSAIRGWPWRAVRRARGSSGACGGLATSLSVDTVAALCEHGSATLDKHYGRSCQLIADAGRRCRHQIGHGFASSL